MGKKYKLAGFVFVILGLVTVLSVNLLRADVLHPKGLIAQKEFNLIVFAVLLMMVIVVPVFVMTFAIVWKYRESNHTRHKKVKYQPDWDRSRLAETVWWLFPLLIIGILSVVTWQSSHELDPFRRISSTVKPMTIQAIALRWKWLFIYPDQKIASVNYVQLPVNTPIEFEITSDGPMNSFWIPALGGQMYAMSGMSTNLNLLASETGSYRGSSANISGEGFAGMNFTAKATNHKVFNSWLGHAQKSPRQLDKNELASLMKPSKNNMPELYTLADDELYNEVMTKYMAPETADNSHMHMDGE